MNRMADTLEILKDKQWHTLGEIINKIGDQISPEKATQLYPKHIKNPVPLDEQVFLGRRWAVMKIVNELVRTRRILVRGEKFQREFKLPEPGELPPENKKQEKSDVEIAIEILEKNYKYHGELGSTLDNPGYNVIDISDIQFHIRAIKRIIGAK